MRYFSIYIIPAVVILLSIPMVLGKVPPNAFYGFRTQKTLSSPVIWYAANRASGWYLIVAGVFSLCVTTLLFVVSPDWLFNWLPVTRDSLFNFLPVFTIGPLLVSLAASFRYLRRLS